MTDTYRIVGLAGRGAVAVSDGGTPPSHEPFLADLVLHADGEIDLATAARAASDALAQPHATLLPRAESVARAVRDAVDVVSVEVTLHRPEVGLGVPVTDVELTIVRPRVSAGAGGGLGAGTGAGVGAGVPVDAAVFADAAPAAVTGPADGGYVDDAAHAARHANRAGGPFDDVLSGRGAASSQPSGTLAGITGGALAARGLGVAGVGAAGGAGAAGSSGGVAASGAAASSDLDVDPSPTTVRTSDAVGDPDVADGDEASRDEAVGDENDDHASAAADAPWSTDAGTDGSATRAAGDRADHDADEDVRSAAEEAGLAPVPHAEHVFQAPAAPGLPAAASEATADETDREIEPTADEDDLEGRRSAVVDHGSTDDEPSDEDAGAEDEEDEEDALARTSVAETSVAGAGAMPVAAPSAPAMQPRRPSADAPMPALVVLSGRGSSAQNELAGAVRAIGTAAGLDVTGVSPLARTTTGGGDLHTAVVAVITTLGPGELASALSAVSASRPSVEAEILVVGDLVGVHDGVELPLPGVTSSATVLVPWAQLDPQAVLPGLGGGPVVVLAETAPDRESVRWLALDWLE